MYVVLISLTGALISVILYHFNLPFYLGIVIIALSLIFFFSSHRGFTHSFLGIILQSLAMGLMLFLASQLLLELNLFNAKIVVISLIVLFIAILFVNKKVLFVVFILIMFSIWKFNTFDISFINCIFPVFLGLLSHMILDSFSPSGVRPFIPFSNKKFYKNFGIAMIIILAIIFILIFTNNFDNIFDVVNNFFNLNF